MEKLELEQADNIKQEEVNLTDNNVVSDTTTVTYDNLLEETNLSQNNEKSNKYKDVIQALKFLMFSISAGVIQIAIFTLLNEVVKLPYWPAYLIGLVCSVLWNFTLNRKYTFKAANNVPIAMLKVLGYYLVFTPLSTLWGDALEGIGWNEYLVLALTMIINFSTEFVYSKFFVFREKKNK